jgi:hypothetical protein
MGPDLVDRLDRRGRMPRAATILVLYLALAGSVVLVGGKRRALYPVVPEAR